MKGKKGNYALLLLLLLIWGAIVYRVVSASSKPEGYVEKTVRPAINPVQQRKHQWPDSLLLDYPDPFLTGAPSVEHKPAVREDEDMQVGHFVQESIWPEIAYLGQIRSVDGKKEIVLLQINGQNRMMRMGDELEGIRYLRKTGKGVMLWYMGEQKEIGGNE